MDKTERFGLVLRPDEKTALEKLAEKERISAAAVIRRLIWREAKLAEALEGPWSALERCHE